MSAKKIDSNILALIGWVHQLGDSSLPVYTQFDDIDNVVWSDYGSVFRDPNHWGIGRMRNGGWKFVHLAGKCNCAGRTAEFQTLAKAVEYAKSYLYQLHRIHIWQGIQTDAAARALLAH